MMEKIQKFKDTEIAIKEHCSKNQNQPLDEHFMEKGDSALFGQCINSPSGAKITPETAISLVHRYCQGLTPPSAPVESVMSYPLGVQFSVRLPSNSCIPEAVGGPLKSNPKLAKKAVYMMICQLLVDRDALDVNFIPRNAKRGSISGHSLVLGIISRGRTIPSSTGSSSSSQTSDMDVLSQDGDEEMIYTQSPDTPEPGLSPRSRVDERPLEVRESHENNLFSKQRPFRSRITSSGVCDPRIRALGSQTPGDVKFLDRIFPQMVQALEKVFLRIKQKNRWN
jgi:hypothetical protein